MTEINNLNVSKSIQLFSLLFILRLHFGDEAGRELSQRFLESVSLLASLR